MCQSPVLTSSEKTQLEKRNFIESYDHNHKSLRKRLVLIAKKVYINNCSKVFGKRLTKDQHLSSYYEVLKGSDAYLDIAHEKGLPTTAYKEFACLLAKYVLEQDWTEISRVVCP